MEFFFPGGWKRDRSEEVGRDASCVRKGSCPFLSLSLCLSYSFFSLSLAFFSSLLCSICPHLSFSKPYFFLCPLSTYLFIYIVFLYTGTCTVACFLLPSTHPSHPLPFSSILSLILSHPSCCVSNSIRKR